MHEPSLGNLLQLLEAEEYAQVEVLNGLPDDLSTLRQTLASLALEGGGTLIVATDVTGLPGDSSPDLVATIERLEILCNEVPFECGANAVPDHLRYLAYVAVASVGTVPTSLEILTKRQARLLAALCRAEASERFAGELLAIVTHNDGWSVNIKNIVCGRNRRISGFAETDLHALKDEGLITLLERGTDATLSLKPKAGRLWRGAISDLLGASLRAAVAPPSTTKNDVFLCHASEQKADVVRPLRASFKEAGIKCWYDEAQITWGQSITNEM